MKLDQEGKGKKGGKTTQQDRRGILNVYNSDQRKQAQALVHSLCVSNLIHKGGQLRRREVNNMRSSSNRGILAPSFKN